MSRRKLLIVTTVPQTLATILRDQPRFLSQQFDVTLATSPGKELRAVAENEGVPVELVPMVRGIDLAADVRSIVRMVGVIRRLKPDAVHSYTPKAGLVAMTAAAFCRVPVRIHTFTGLIFPVSSGVKRLVLKWADRLTALCATRVIPEGEGVRRDLERFAITRKPLQVLGHGNIAGVDTSHFNPDNEDVKSAAQRLAADIGLQGVDRVFCFIGRLHRDKGLKELVQAFSLLPPDAHLVIVGVADESVPIDADTQRGLEHPRIHQLGFLEDVRPALAVSDALVLPSYREGFPNVILQAGAMRLPSIGANVSGCNEFVTPGVNGWLVEPRDTDALCRAMHEALTLPRDELDAMGEESRRRVRERHERLAYWQTLRRFYEAELQSSATQQTTPPADR
jgi:glycosyltransferase involved in cell wall biosynthesis